MMRRTKAHIDFALRSGIFYMGLGFS
jgi:hypothetical protein